MNCRCITLCILLSVITFILGCQSNPPKTEAKISPPEIRFHSDVASAATFLANALAHQLSTTPRPLQPVLVDELVNSQTAEISLASTEFQKQFIEALEISMRPTKFMPLAEFNISGQQWVIFANYSATDPTEVTLAPGKWLRIQIAAVQSDSGKIMAKVTTYLDASKFNAEPLRFFRDAPLFMTDSTHRDRVLFDRPIASSNPDKLITTQAIFNDAVRFYESAQYQKAEAAFAKVRTLVPDHIGAISGLYQTLWKTNRQSDAEKAFEDLIAVSIDKDFIAIKLLFRLGSAAFIDSFDLTSQYRLWLRTIGRVAVLKDRCIDVIGHASKSGPAELNDRLSLQRAENVTNMIIQNNREARTRFKAIGRGFREVIVGNGANDATDAIDRRVEFKLRSCS